MTFARFEDLLERTMGLNAASIGASAVERAVRARLRACKLEDADDYWQQILRSSEELQDLVEAVVVPETWFFRDPEAFRTMARIITDEWLPRYPSNTLRLLSLPCSTGEEPYTMAMALIDAGLPPNRFTIDAINISRRALAHAECGIYGRNSFRGRDLAFRSRHFEKMERGYKIEDRVAGAVRFAQGNLLDANFPRGAEAYDIIFCRNLLIYFDTNTQDRGVEVLKRLLAPQGMLFVGHSETGLMLGHGLASAKIPMAFAFRKTPPRPSAPSAETAPERPPLPRSSTTARATPSPALKPKRPSVVPLPSIDELRCIADRGQLAEAAQGCEAYLRQHGPSPESFLLLGLIKDASGDPVAATQYYRKALYLAPDHPEALGHLALLLKKQGDDSGAKVLDDRMRRLTARRAG